MEHYFTQKPTAEHNERIIEYSVDNIRLNFITDSGVFSRARADYGSDLLIKSLPPLTGKILDLGCGYGLIGLSLAKLYPQTDIDLVDINERAINLTKKNMALNNIENARIYQSDGFSNVTGLYNCVVSNPPIRAGKNVIYTLFEQSKEFILPGGSLYIVIQKKQGAPSARNKLNSVFGNCETINKSAGYWILRSNK